MGRRLVLLREGVRWIVPGPVRIVYSLTAYPRIKAGVSLGVGVMTAGYVVAAEWFGSLPVFSQAAFAVGAGLIGASILGVIWHWLEGSFLGDDAKRRRLGSLYHQQAFCALDQVIHMWNTIRDSDREGLNENAKIFANSFQILDGIVVIPILNHRAHLETALSNPASSLDEIVKGHQIVFQYYWRALLWIHATMGFVGLVPDSEQYRAMMRAHDEYSKAVRLLALQPGFRKLGKVLRTVNREREMVVTPWTVRYE